MTRAGACACALVLATSCAGRAPSAPPVAAAASIAPIASDDDTEREPAIAGGEGEGDVDAPAAVATVARPPTGAALLAEANRELAAMRSSTYTHHTHVDEAAGDFEYDCSGFLEYALGRAAPAALAALVDATVRRPLAKHVVGFLRDPGGRGGWRAVERAIDLAPGDVIAWLKPADVVTRNTGHVLIVRERPHDDPARGGVVVPIIDATSVRHGRGDSRRATRATGLGTGEIVLVVDERGGPVGYRWSLAASVRAHTTTIALGRLGP